MKGRLIGALWIILALAIFYFGLNGEWFPFFFCVCLMMCLVEISAIADLKPYQVKPSACKPQDAWRFEYTIVYFAAIFCILLKKEELLLIIIVCSLSDTGAFTFGKLFGRHKAWFTSGISPNKTVEGYIGGIVFTLIAIPVCFLLKIAITPALVIYLLLSGLAAEIGDLLGSATKRQLQIKDSGDGVRNMPVLKLLEYPIRGHGGYLDRMDSISLNIVLFTIIMVPWK